MIPETWSIGGEESYLLYEKKFKALFLDQAVFDICQRRVIFTNSSCRHICYKEPSGSPAGVERTVFRADRASRIPWVLATLIDPEQIREETVAFHIRWTYMAKWRDYGQNNPKAGFYAVVVELKPDGSLFFVTSFALNNHREWTAKLQHGRRIWQKGQKCPEASES